MKTSSIGLILLFFYMLNVHLSVFAQQNNSIEFLQLEKIFQSLNTSKPISMIIEYYELDMNNNSTKVSDGKYYKIGSYGRYAFGEYDQLVNADYFLKVDHVQKQMIIVENKTGDDINNESAQVLEKFRPEYFSENGYEASSSLSNLKAGLVTVNSKDNPYYNKIELRFNTENNHPISYTLYFREGLAKDVKAIQIQFKNILINEFDEQVLNEKIFFIKRGNKFIPTNKYLTYEIINL